MADATETRSRISPTDTSSAGSILVRGLHARTSTRTRWPSRRSAFATAAPTKPLAPVTRTGSPAEGSAIKHGPRKCGWLEPQPGQFYRCAGAGQDRPWLLGIKHQAAPAFATG